MDIALWVAATTAVNTVPIPGSHYASHGRFKEIIEKKKVIQAKATSCKNQLIQAFNPIQLD